MIYTRTPYKPYKLYKHYKLYKLYKRTMNIDTIKIFQSLKTPFYYYDTTL